MDFEFTLAQQDLQRRARQFTSAIITDYPSWPVALENYSDDLKSRLLALKEQYGLSGLDVPQEYGGQGLGATEDAIVLAELWKVPRFLPGGEMSPWPVMYDAPDPIKKKYLFPVLSGEAGWSMCFSEPDAGSDLAAIRTTAILDNNEWVINGRKIWRTGHAEAAYTAVAAVTDPTRGSRGISIFLVDEPTPGFRKVRDIPVAARQWGSEEELVLENVRVPRENLLGELGQGFTIAQHQFNRFRVRMGAIALAMAERSQEIAVDWANQREVFGRKLGDHQAIQWMLTDNAFDIECIRWNTFHAAWLVDQAAGDYKSARLHGSLVKGYCMDAGLRVVDRCMQILGGRGLAIDDYPFFDFYNQLRMGKQMEGSTEIMKIVMAREILGRRI